LVVAVTQKPVYRSLAELMTAVTLGPVGVLRDALAEIPGIEEAFIYGSWAARYHGQPGAVPGDIDVLVIGDVDRHLLDYAVEEAERKLHREVNARRVGRPQEWDAESDAFKATVTSRPVVHLVGGVGG
jgi:predicted nucleotidyltransferase